MAHPRKKATPVAKLRHHKAKARFAQIKKYVNFKFRDDDYTARKIREIYNELWPLLHQPHADYSPRSNKKKSVALQSVGLRRRKSYKAVPIPNAGVEGVSVRVEGDSLTVTSDFLTQRYLSFNKRALARGAKRHVDKLVSGARRNDLFRVQTGNYEIRTTFARDMVAEEVAKLQMKYQVGNVIEGRGKIGKSQSWHNWLNGLVQFEVKNQKSIPAVMKRLKERDAEKNKSYKENKKKRVK